MTATDDPSNMQGRRETGKAAAIAALILTSACSPAPPPSKAPLALAGDSRGKPRLDEGPGEVPSNWLLGDGRLAWRLGNEAHLVDPDSLAVVATITSPDGTAPGRLENGPDPTRFLMVSEAGRPSLWTSSGVLIAASRETVGHIVLYGLSWNATGDRILTLEGAGDSTRAWLWTVTGTELVRQQLADGRYHLGGFLRNSAGVWLRGEGSFTLKDFEGTPLHTFDCDDCVLSPDETAVAVNRFEPKRETSVVDLATGQERWRSADRTAHLWAPSMKWLVSPTRREAGIVNASNGRVVARWPYSGCEDCAEWDEMWFGEMLVHARGDRLIIWRPGQGLRSLPRPRSRGIPYIKPSHRGDRFVTMNMILDREGKLLAELESPGSSGAAPDSWSPDDAYIEGYAKHEGPVVWDSKTGRIVQVLQGAAYGESGERQRLENVSWFWSPAGHLLLLQDRNRLLRWSKEGGLVGIRMSTEGELKAEVENLDATP